jgi:hypothetical protein
VLHQPFEIGVASSVGWAAMPSRDRLRRGGRTVYCRLQVVVAEVVQDLAETTRAAG